MGWLAEQYQCEEFQGISSNFDGNLLQVAWIDEHQCIGCFKCITACPVSAIVGARKMVHTVVSSLCIGCSLCQAPCPTDCIEMKPITEWPHELRQHQALENLQLTQNRQAEKGRKIAAPRTMPVEQTSSVEDARRRQVADAVARMQARKLQNKG